MFKSFTVKSKIRDAYTVFAINDLTSSLENNAGGGNVIFIIDDTVNKLFEKDLKHITSAHRHIIISTSEDNKTLDYSQIVIRQLLGANVRKSDILIAIGGGITQDIVAFISSVLFRGVEWKFYPTTLLAQCDSCIGSKSSINFDSYKNLIGTFNPPSEIFIYPGFLLTLTTDEIKSGIGEMLHYFFSNGIKLAQEICDQYDELLHDRNLLLYFIENSLNIKKAIIEQDEFDTDLRHIFNYGHTFGHAIEAITKYQIPHGQAISIGMDLANYISLSKKMINEDQFTEMHLILGKNMPPFKLTETNMPQYLSALSKDKKNKGNQLGCILTRGPGKLEKVFLNMDTDFSNLLLEYFGKR